MFWIKWAGKNLLMNKKRTAGKILFISLVLLIAGMGLMFLEGTNRQLKTYLRHSMGDLVATGRGVKTNLLPVYEYLKQEHAGLIEESIRTYRAPAEFLGNTGYARGSLNGVEPAYFFYLDSCVSWPEKPVERLAEGTALVEYFLAAKLNLRRGDSLFIRIRTEEGMYNTLQVRVAGVFLGAGLLFAGEVFINISDMERLFMTGEKYAGEIKAYFKEGVPEAEMIALQQDLVKRFSALALFKGIHLNPSAVMIYQEFQYYRMILVFLLAVVIFVFFFILYFAVQNSFFLSYRARRREISTLLAYGMTPFAVKRIAFWEGLILFSCALVLAGVLATGLVFALQEITLVNPQMADLIGIIGGPRLRFAVPGLPLAVAIGLLLAISLYAVHKGVGTYLRMEVREILAGI